jgi:histidine ammonia-lyase
MVSQFRYGIDKLSVSTALEIANGKLKGILCPEAVSKIIHSAVQVKEIVEEVVRFMALIPDLAF